MRLGEVITICSLPPPATATTTPSSASTPSTTGSATAPLDPCRLTAPWPANDMADSPAGPSRTMLACQDTSLQACVKVFRIGGLELINYNSTRVPGEQRRLF